METFGNWCAGILCISLFGIFFSLAVVGWDTVITYDVIKLKKTDLIKSGNASYKLDSITGKTEFVLDSTFLKEQ